MMKRRLVIFTRFPEPHKAKTRLIPALGPEGAAALGCDMTRHTLACVRELAKDFGVPVEVRFEGGDAERMTAAFGNGFPYRRQGTGDLGCRMERAFAEVFCEGAERIVIIGTDCPEITPGMIRESFERLATCDLVLGPATDGGYYLIGLRRPAPQLFIGIPWGSERVLAETLRRAKAIPVEVSLLKTLSDVDRPEDLAVWHRVQCSGHATTTGRISVIVPTLNEAEHLPQTLLSLKDAENMETIVVDGGSTDGTAEIAERARCHLLRSPPGRALQMNAGARAASGSILLFLHADTRLPERFDEHVRRALGQPRTTLRAVPVAGAFHLRIDGPQRSLRLIEWGTNFRSRHLQMPYGDQTLFLKAETFRTIGGFPELPIMDDFEMVRRLRRLGRIAILPFPVTTSARRWLALGPWRTMWINQKVIAGYYIGVSPGRLAKWYSGSNGPGG
jgi:rSAM/selenodomain-associated transferase 2/rSAM/selenodomain-associated transferase 1